ncbi:MAG: hypothetical protein NC201_06200 [Prevotella sp.]|nr:hypothetical protein [Bacteroides sp.]MCM1366822.1 hypothetical protein [Prevotella sp.]MCM1437403.1 hypothetical protein [Prevotella sp.]
MSLNSSGRLGLMYEKVAYRYLKGELEAGRLPFHPDNSRIFLHRRYKALCGNVVDTDISIESYCAGDEKYSLLTLVECKNLRSSVQTHHLNDLITKIGLLRANMGIMICNTIPTEGTIVQARYFGISIMHLTECNNVRRIV